MDCEEVSTQQLIYMCCKIVLRERSTEEIKTPKLNNIKTSQTKTLPKPKHFSVWIWGCQSSTPECLGRHCRWFGGAQIRKGWAPSPALLVLSCWPVAVTVPTLTGPLMVPEARRSPGLRLQPLMEWWASCCFMVQYMCWRKEEEGLKQGSSKGHSLVGH